MKHHPYTEIWPLLSGKEFDQLKADIKANGLKMPVLVYKDQVLDGRNRQRACEETGVAIRYAEAEVNSDDEALNLVVSLNQYRRHLSVAELAFAADKVANIINGHNQHRDKVEGDSRESPCSKTSLKQAAAKLGVSRNSVIRARKIRTEGTEADVKEVLTGRKGLQAKADEVHARKRKPPSQPRPAGNGNGGRVIALYKGPPLRTMTPQEVDPEFNGTPMEFIDKYGHVQVKTAEEYATMRFGEWASWMRSLAKRGRELPPLPNRPVDHNWLRSPEPNDVKKLTEALIYLWPIIAEAKALLERAKQSRRAAITPPPA
jgi:hypothetical protein